MSEAITIFLVTLLAFSLFWHWIQYQILLTERECSECVESSLRRCEEMWRDKYYTVCRGIEKAQKDAGDIKPKRV